MHRKDDAGNQYNERKTMKYFIRILLGMAWIAVAIVGISYCEADLALIIDAKMVSFKSFDSFYNLWFSQIAKVHQNEALYCQFSTIHSTANLRICCFKKRTPRSRNIRVDFNLFTYKTKFNIYPPSSALKIKLCHTMKILSNSLK